MALMMMFLLTACGGAKPEGSIPPQQWQNIEFQIQTRPEVIQPGMIEFLVLATELHGRPVHDLVISLRMQEDDAWRQAIQDGLSGVYRRALHVPASTTGVSVLVQRKGAEEKIELQFPLQLM